MGSVVLGTSRNSGILQGECGFALKSYKKSTFLTLTCIHAFKLFLGICVGHAISNLHEDIIFALFEHSTSTSEHFASTYSRRVVEIFMKIVINVQKV